MFPWKQYAVIVHYAKIVCQNKYPLPLYSECNSFNTPVSLNGSMVSMTFGSNNSNKKSRSGFLIYYNL